MNAIPSSSIRSVLVIVLATIVLWQPALPASAQDAECGYYAVAVAPQPAGHPLADNFVQVFDSTGKRLEAPFAQPASAVPSPRPRITLLRSLGGLYSLLDTRSGAVMPLDIPADQQPLLVSSSPALQNASVSDFLLLTNNTGAFWLVDLTSGEAQELSAVVPGAGYIESAIVAPDAKSLLIYLDDMGYVLSLSAPGTPQPLAREPVLRFPGYSADGHTILFATGQAGATATIRSYDPTSGASTELGSAAHVETFVAHMGNPILTLDAHELRAFPSDDVTANPIFTWQGSPAGLISEWSGQYLLIGDRTGDTTSWYRVDTHSGATSQLMELEGFSPLAQGATQDSVTFFSGKATGPGTPGTPYRTLDLTTGEIATPLTQDSTDVWSIHLAGDTNGRYTVVNAVSPGSGRMWLVDARAGTATLIGTSSGNVAASVSPDGCQLAVGIFDTLGEGRTSTVNVTSRIDGAPIATVPNAILLGWAQITGG